MQRARAGLKRRALLRSAVAAIALVAVLGGPQSSAAHNRVSFEFFESNLEPFGSWHASASYGRVWIPRLQVIGWHPYTYGHWVYTDFGWTWVSDYEWGAIPYHYGTWVLESELGWVWVPGYVWAPAWVVFRTGPSYVGWAPVPPSYSIGTSVSFSNHGADHYVFVRETDFLAPHVHRYAVPLERTRVVYNETKIINNNIRIENNVVVNRGLDVRRVERVARAPVSRAPIEDVPRVAPAEHVSRDGLRVDPDRIERGRVRAVAPTTERPPREFRREREPQVMQPQREEPRTRPREPGERRGGLSREPEFERPGSDQPREPKFVRPGPEPREERGRAPRG